MKSIKFTNPRKTDFHKTVTKRVELYFKDKGISPYADNRMVIKTACMFALYFVPYFLILSGSIPIYAMWFCCAVMGLGLAGIGMAVMHDANHGAYSDKRWVNRLLGYSLEIVGGNSANWKIQHNQQHHTYTNIHEYDYDIRERMNLRFTPAVEYRKVHRFQLFYAFVLYGLQTFFWVLIKDFANFYQYAQDGTDKLDKRGRAAQLATMIFSKMIYIGYMIILPVVILHLTWWQLLIGFMTMHVIAGLILTTVFQLAHVVEDTWFPEPDTNGSIDEEWAIQQMRTTVDFAPKNKWLTFYVGGLNYQVEHHLFQRICHVHYPKIAPIVQQTAAEYGIPYLCNDTFSSAFGSHLRLLKKLSLGQTIRMAVEMG